MSSTSSPVRRFPIRSVLVCGATVLLVAGVLSQNGGTVRGIIGSVSSQPDRGIGTAGPSLGESGRGISMADRVLHIGDSATQPSQPVLVPVSLENAQGNEYTVQASVEFNTALLTISSQASSSNPDVIPSIGSGMENCLRSVNTSEIAQGHIGVGVSCPLGGSEHAKPGNQIIFFLRFTPTSSATLGTQTQVKFRDSPFSTTVGDSTATAFPFTTISGSVSVQNIPVSVSVSPSSVKEDGTGKLAYLLTRAGNTGSRIDVQIDVGGTATRGVDYIIDGYPCPSPCNSSSFTATFASGSSTTTITVDPTPDVEGELNETVIFNLRTNAAYTLGSPSSATGTIENDDTLCGPITLTMGASYEGLFDSQSCKDNSGNRTDLYTFTGAANQRIVGSMISGDFLTKMELLDAQEVVLQQVVAGVNGNNTRLPKDEDAYTLAVAGTYKLRVSAQNGSLGRYTVKVDALPVPVCKYTLSSSQTDIPASGGSFFFDVVTTPGCPPAQQPSMNGQIYTNLSYAYGRVKFTVGPTTLGRQDSIGIGGQTHRLNQFPDGRPPNDNFGSATLISDAVVPTPSPTVNPTPTVTPTRTPTPLPSPTPSPTPTVTPVPACSPDFIKDGGFEQTDDFLQNGSWDSTKTGFSSALCVPGAGTCIINAATAPRTGKGWVVFDDFPFGGVSDGSLTQTVQFPSGGKATLSFYLLVARVSTAAHTATLKVQIDGVTLRTINEPSAPELGYTQRTVDVSAYANGGNHTIRFVYNRPSGASYETWDLDDVSLSATCGTVPSEQEELETKTLSTGPQGEAATDITDTLGRMTAATAPLAIPTPLLGYNTNATAEQMEPAHAGNTPSRSIWYTYTPTTEGLYSFSTSGSSFDTVMAIYACPPVLPCSLPNIGQPIASNDDTTFFDKTSKVNFHALAKTQYMIAIDGKNGTSGTVVLNRRQYTRLYRLYLQNFNGDPSGIIPDFVTATNGSNTVVGQKLSQGVYEFDLPADSGSYRVQISGPAGIVWDPNNFAIDPSFRLLDELMQGPLEGGENSTSNAMNSTDRFFKGYIRNLTGAEIPSLSVTISSSRGANPRPAQACIPIDKTVSNSVPYATYQCVVQPQTIYDIVPDMQGKKFDEPNQNNRHFDRVLNEDDNDFPATGLVASDAATFGLTGRVLAGGAGSVVTLTGRTPGILLDVPKQTSTDAAGNYSFNNLPPGKYRLRATHAGFAFTEPADVDLQGNMSVNLPAIMTCSYRVSTPPLIPIGGGQSQFTVTTTAGCEWTALRGQPWITINSGASGIGTGTVQFTLPENTEVARAGKITVADQTVPISQAGINPVPVISDIDWPFRKIGTVPFTMTVRGSGFVNGSKVRLDGQERTTTFVSDTVLQAQIPQTDFQTLGKQSQITVFSPTPGGGASNPRTFTTIARPAVAFDYDGDRKADMSVFRPGNLSWYISRSTDNGTTLVPFGSVTDSLVPADYDGDGKTDMAVFTPSLGIWQIINSKTGTVTFVRWGASGDIPLPGDFDGDGKADQTVYRPSQGRWYVNNSSQPSTVEQFGSFGDVPLAGDFDGDGRADLAVYRPITEVSNSGVWYVNRSTDGFLGVRFGASNDKLVPADYDGDGKTDFALFRQSNGVFYLFLSANNAYTGGQYGFGDDIPVPADYDGRGRANVGVFRPSNGNWYVTDLSFITTGVVNFGQAGDKPTPSAYVSGFFGILAR